MCLTLPASWSQSPSSSHCSREGLRTEQDEPIFLIEPGALAPKAALLKGSKHWSVSATLWLFLILDWRKIPALHQSSEIP